MMGIKKTTDQFKQEVYDLVGDEYTVLSEYINTNTKIMIQHNICKSIYYVKPNYFLAGNRCPECRKNKKLNIDTIKKKVYEQVKDEYTVLSDHYESIHKKILFRHNTCNHTFEMSTNSFLRNKNRCPKCSKRVWKDTDYFKQEVLELVKTEYDVLGTYQDTHTKILFRHNICKCEFEMTPNNFLNTGCRCPHCITESKGESIIAKFLDYNHIKYEREKSFKECKHINLLRFDFYIPNLIHNKTGKKVNLLIEFQGMQHYKESYGIDKEDKKRNFKLIKLRDDIKKEFIRNGQKGLSYDLVLIKIPYTALDNLEAYLVNLFSNKFLIPQYY